MEEWICDDRFNYQLFAQEVNNISEDEAEKIIREYENAHK